MSTKRKGEHIEYAMEYGENHRVFQDIHILYDSIPEIDFQSINTEVELLGRKFGAPIMIDAITGGTGEGERINKALSSAAARLGIPMAVGSQSIAIRDKEARRSFTIVRDVNRDGFIIANVGASVSIDIVREAVEMIGADGVELHLNMLQELMMPEGDRSFKGILENIRYIRENMTIPVIVKEVGFGMWGGTAARLGGIGVEILDIGGYGGTNFARIELMRRNESINEDLCTIGIPTPVSLYDVCRRKPGISVICGGGIRSGLDAAKALIMGADAVSVAYPVLRAYKDGGEEGIVSALKKLIWELKMSMASSGAETLKELHAKDIIITGRTLEWINQLNNIKVNKSFR
jgi:isopentenyl-diphosphate delta-isomerase